MAENTKHKPIRVGVVGVGRGRSFMRAAASTGMELVAICDTWEERLKPEGKALGVSTYVDYSAFLEHDMDAVVLANYFHVHAPFAIGALNAGKTRHERNRCLPHIGRRRRTRAGSRAQWQNLYVCRKLSLHGVQSGNEAALPKRKCGENLKYGEGEYVHPDPPEVKNWGAVVGAITGATGFPRPIIARIR